jgi:4-hydroxy-tetrahydrodipicolinate reductase
MRILISGLKGFMGNEVARLAAKGYRGAELVYGVDPAEGPAPVPCYPSFAEAPADVDVVVDFSHHSCTQELLDYAVKNGLRLVLATTGQTEEEREAIRKASESIPLFFAANYSLGIALLIELARKTAAAMPDAEIEIVEVHHDRKVDAPSGTALAIAEAIRQIRPESTLHSGRSGMGKRTPEEIGIHAVRMGNVVGIHEVMIGTQNQTITLKHEAHSRALFAEGALAAADFLMGKPAGLYNMTSLLDG